MAKKVSKSDATDAGSQEAIARRAYEIWESEGRPDGRAMEHWLRAVSELKAQDGGQPHRESPESAPTQRTSRRSTPRLNENRFQTTQ